jgi:acyl-CoA synthetase (AMP-forming)/AMP-acid ligase II
VRRERITHTALVPIQLQRMVECMRGGDHDVSSMHAMMSCGSPLRAALKQELFEYFSCGIIELYGLTEGVITTLDPEDAKGRWSSVGKPLMGTDIRIIGDDDREAPQGEAGEIVSRGRVTMPGYFNRPEATSAAVWRDAEGRPWLRTGDIGRLDEQNFLYIVDRKKDLILSGGQNVYPQDIEAVLVTHAGVDDAAVIGLPSRRWEETPVAIVVPRDPASFDPDALRTWCNERVGKQQRIGDVIAVAELPRNPNGKLLKRELRERFAGRIYD